MKPRIPKTPLGHFRIKPRRETAKDHLRFIRSLECPIYPGSRPIEAHHLLRADPKRGMGRKAADRYVIPLSKLAHIDLHLCGDEVAYLGRFGIDGRALAAKLWKISGDTDAALVTVGKAKRVTRVKL